MTDQQNQSPHISINTFTAVEGGLDALVAFQITEMQEMSAEAATYGWIGNEVYRSHDDTSLIVFTSFRSEEARESWAQTARFRQHIEGLQPLIQNSTSIPVTFLAAHGKSVPH